MPVLQFKGKTAIESYHHTVLHHTLEFDSKLSVMGKGEKPGLDGNLIIEGDNLIALKALLPTHAGRKGWGGFSLTDFRVCLWPPVREPDAEKLGRVHDEALYLGPF